MKRRGMTPKRLEQAVALCWEDRDTDAEIAKRLNVGRRTLSRWKQTPAFRAQIAALSEAYSAESRQESIERWQAEHAGRCSAEIEMAQKCTKSYIEANLLPESLPKISPMEGRNASLQRQFVRCGKAGCRCTRGELHGPYYYLFGWNYKTGRVWKEYVKKADVEQARERVAAYRLGQRLQRHFNRVGWQHSTPELVRWLLRRGGNDTSLSG